MRMEVKDQQPYSQISIENPMTATPHGRHGCPGLHHRAEVPLHLTLFSRHGEHSGPGRVAMGAWDGFNDNK
jgi:hypothetical protein